REDDDAVVPVVAMTDSVKEVRAEGLRNIDRASLAGLQSPRLMRRGVLESALDDDGRPADAGGFDEIRAALDRGARVRTVHGSHSGFAVLDRLSLWQAQISLGLARATSHRQGLTRRSCRAGHRLSCRAGSSTPCGTPRPSDGAWTACSSADWSPDPRDRGAAAA